MLNPPESDTEYRPLVKASDVAEACAVSSRFVLLLAERGTIPCIRLGRKAVRFVPGEVETALGLPHGIIRRVVENKEPHPPTRRMGFRYSG